MSKPAHESLSRIPAGTGEVQAALTSRASLPLAEGAATRVSAVAAAAAGPSGWQRPVAPGVEPAYDEALAFLADYQQGVRRQIEQLKKEGAGGGSADIAARIEELEIAAELDDPMARWEFEQGRSASRHAVPCARFL